jgi:hypothetical protein
MTRQKTQPDLQDLFKHADRYLELCIQFFHGIQEKLDEAATTTNVDSTWRSATDTVDDTPAATPEPEVDPLDQYLATLELRYEAYMRAGEIKSAGAIRRVINDLRGLDDEQA